LGEETIGKISNLKSLVGQLRLVSTDQAASPALRETAAARLQELKSARLADGKPLVPSADPKNWWGIKVRTSLAKPKSEDEPENEQADSPTPIRLNASSLTALLTCPRRWFLSNKAAGETPSAMALSFGTLFHRLCEIHAVSGEPREAFLNELRQSLPGLPEVPNWQKPAFEQRALDMANRFLTWRDGRKERELVCTELAFQFSLQNQSGLAVLLSGKVDRIERNAFHQAVVVDFKTGKYRTLDEHRDQLGCYELAVLERAFPSELGLERSAAPELVFPREVPRKTVSGDVGCRVVCAPTLGEEPHREVQYGSEDHPTWLHARIFAAAEIVRENRFDAVPKNCRGCQFKAGCPAFGSSEVQDD
jgi:RecB family exonuclease